MNLLRFTFPLLFGLLLVASSSCTSQEENLEMNTEENPTTMDQSDYWVNKATEVSTYTLSQSRYGQKREGYAVLTTSVDRLDSRTGLATEKDNEWGVEVLKTSLVKQHTTGVMDNTISSSCYTPLDNGASSFANKLVSSVHNWQSTWLTQFNLKGNRFSVQTFGHEKPLGDKSYELPAVFLLDEVFAIIRINPQLLPTGKFQAVPFLEQCYFNQLDADLEPFESLLNELPDEGVTEYILKSGKYIFKVVFQTEFPHQIESWTEFEVDQKGIPITSSVTRAKRLRTMELELEKRLNNKSKIFEIAWVFNSRRSQ